MKQIKFVILSLRYYLKKKKYFPLVKSILFWCLFISSSTAYFQCEADTTIYLNDFNFIPNTVTITPGQSVAFINAEGLHNVDGTSENNPEAFFLDEVAGDIQGVCMGVVTFSTPGVYNFTSSVGVESQLGMNGTIIVDAFTLADQFADISTYSGLPETCWSWMSGYSFNQYFSSVYPSPINLQPYPNPAWLGDIDLNGLENYTVFVPTDDAVNAVGELMNLGQFDLLAFYDLPQALKYHIVPGYYTLDDLNNEVNLTTIEGQPITISSSIESAETQVDNATIICPDILTFNGVIHIIDEVLAPDGYPAATTWDYIVQSENHTFFKQALINEGLQDALIGQPILNDNEPAEGPFTVFAPTDDAFILFAEENGFESVTDLINSQFIDDIVNLHLVEAVYQTEDFYNNQILMSYDNSSISVALSDADVFVNTIPISVPDQLAYNGVVHVLDKIMPIEIPEPEGTCGSWKFVLTGNTPSSSGWQGASLNVFSNNTLIASETKTSTANEFFTIPVDLNAKIDVLYTGSGNASNYHDYVIYDESNTIIFNNISNNSPTPNVYGLRPCGTEYSCGLVEIVFFDGDTDDGWYGGGIDVLSDDGLIANIYFNPDFDNDGFYDYIPFSEKSIFVQIEPEEIDFIVSQPLVENNSCGYTVVDDSGQIIIDQNNSNFPPMSMFDIVFCYSTNLENENMDLNPIEISPNPIDREEIYLHGIKQDEKWELQLIDFKGQIVFNESGSGERIINSVHTAPGIYLCRIVTQYRQESKKVFIK